MKNEATLSRLESRAVSAMRNYVAAGGKIQSVEKKLEPAPEPRRCSGCGHLFVFEPGDRKPRPDVPYYGTHDACRREAMKASHRRWMLARTQKEEKATRKNRKKAA